MPPQDLQDFSAFFQERLKAKGLTAKRLSELSGIHMTHLENLASAKYSDLPPAPYLRGYLNTLGEILDFDPEPWWQNFKATRVVASSGPADRLPRNRFAPRSLGVTAWLAVAGVIIMAYFGLRWTKIFGQPVITVDEPREATIRTTEPLVTFRGRAENADRLLVNREIVPITSGGTWQKALPLAEGLNTFEIAAEKFLGREVRIVRQIVYESPLPATGTEPVEGATGDD